MPPVSIASIIAIARMPISGDATAMFCRFSGFRKTRGLSTAKNTNVSTVSSIIRPLLRSTWIRSQETR